MTSPWANNGGRRRQHRERVLTADEVADIRAMRAQRVRYKVITRKYPDVSRATLSRAVNMRGGYAT